MDSAVIRPTIGEDNESFLSYYLTKDDKEALAYNNLRKTQRQPLPVTPEPKDEDEGENANDIKLEYPEAAAFHFVRDYETVKIDTEVLNEFLLSLNSGEGVTGDGKGAYYKNIERKYVLKKKRQNVRLLCASLSIFTAAISSSG